jgi:hypothetical protein
VPVLVAGDLSLAAPAVAVNVAVEDAPAAQRGHVRLGQVVGVIRATEELERVQVPLQQRALGVHVAEVALCNVAAPGPGDDEVRQRFLLSLPAHGKVRDGVAIHGAQALERRQDAREQALELHHVRDPVRNLDVIRDADGLVFPLHAESGPESRDAPGRHSPALGGFGHGERSHQHQPLAGVHDLLAPGQEQRGVR